MKDRDETFPLSLLLQTTRPDARFDYFSPGPDLILFLYLALPISNVGGSLPPADVALQRNNGAKSRSPSENQDAARTPSINNFHPGNAAHEALHNASQRRGWMGGREEIR